MLCNTVQELGIHKELLAKEENIMIAVISQCFRFQSKA